MSTTPRLLALAGSTREGSFNRRLVRLGADLARAAGADVTTVELRDLPMPLYDGDLEAREGLPANARRLKELMVASDGILLASPEYNSSIPGTLKNALDWASRAAPGEAPLLAYRGKVAGLLAASPGALGGLRALVHVRAILSSLDVLVLPEQFALAKANEAFDPKGGLLDPKQGAALKRVVDRLVFVTSRLAAPA